jgi:hypothetical protein
MHLAILTDTHIHIVSCEVHKWVLISIYNRYVMVYALSDNKTNSLFMNQSYDTTYSGDCNTIKSTNSSGSVYGYGKINPGEDRTRMVSKLFHKK